MSLVGLEKKTMQQVLKSSGKEGVKMATGRGEEGRA